MKMNHLFSKGGRVTRASVSVALTVLVLVAVLLFNLGFSALSSRSLWFADLTGYDRVTRDGTEVYEMYTLTEDVIELLDGTFADLNATRQNRGEEPVAVEIIFCDDPDNLMKNHYQRMIYLAALELQKQFSDTIEVKNIDVYKNPSAVQRYKSNSYTTIYASTVIVSSGTEYRRLTPSSFFFTDSTTNELWASKVEVNFAAAIRAVTKAAAPKCVLLTGHGESGYTDAFISLLEDVGYEVIPTFDLATETLPVDCRLVVCCAPTRDFVGYREMQAGSATVSEIAKLDAFLDDENSLMVFFNADTPTLPNFEEYLEKWGVTVRRDADASGDAINYLIKDPVGALTSDRQTLVGDYVTTGLGASVTSDMQSQSYPAKVVFRNATALGASPLYRTTYVPVDEETGVTEAYSYDTYATDGVYRSVFNVFTTPEGCTAYAGDKLLTDTEKGETYSLMTIAKESVTAAGDRNGYTTVSHDSYVVAFASSDFLADELLSTNAYGNTDMLSGLLRTLGVDPMSALIDQYIKPFVSPDVADGLISTTLKKNTTVTLCLIPAVIMFGLGIYVMTKRKHS